MPEFSLKFPTLLLLIMLMTGCATLPPPETRIDPTDDLKAVVEDALEMAGMYGKNRVLVVFDIDNTLLAMEQDLGSDQWYDWQKELQTEDPCNVMLVTNRLAVQGALYFASAMRLTQPDASDQIRRLQDEGLSVIALTSRGPEFRLQTFRELRRNGISLWETALPPRQGFGEPFVPEGGSRPARYEDGVFLTAGQHKGDMLKALLKRSGKDNLAVVVFADDKERNLDAVLETFKGTNTAIHAWRYSREDEVVASFDAAAAAELWSALRPPLESVQGLLGPDNYDIPPQVPPEGCPGR